MIVSFDPLEKQVRYALASWAETVGVQIKELSESALLLCLSRSITHIRHSVETFGEAHLIDPLPASADQIASLCYTSVCLSSSLM
jgi:long-chain acyl-CoA synthetase